MADFKRLDDQRYLNTLFGSLARQKEIPVSVLYNNQQVVARLLTDAINKQKINIFPSVILPVATEEIVKISFFYKEIFFIFEAEVLEKSESSFRISLPTSVLASYRRLVERYKPKSHQEAALRIQGQNIPLSLVDVSAKGLAFRVGERLFEEGQTVRNITIRFGNGQTIRLDGVIKHITQNEIDEFMYGIEIISIERHDFRILFTHIFEHTYPYFSLLEAFSGEQIFKLYEQARFLNLKPRDEEDNTFLELVENLEQVKDKSLIASNLVYQKNGKLIALGSVLRIYNRSFLGKPLAMLPQVRLNPKNKTNIYIGLADYLLNHPYYDYYLSYIDTDYEWHQDIFSSAAQIINDQQKFYFDNLFCYEALSGWAEAETNDKHPLPAGDYICETLDKPDQCFIQLCRNNMLPLESEVFGYGEDTFKLDELSQIYQAYGFFLTRKLWRINKGNETVAYVVVECYSDPLSRYSHLDCCKIFPLNTQSDISDIIGAIKAELDGFYSFYEKNSYELILRNNYLPGQEPSLPGFALKGKMGLVLANREGLSEYKQLLLANFEYHSKYFPLTHPQMGIWYLEQMYPGTSIANIAGTLRYHEEFDLNILEQAINLVIERNDGLRLRIIVENGLPKQYITPYCFVHFERFDFSNEGLDSFYEWEKNKTMAPFKLIDSDLFYFAFVKINENDYAIFIKQHHLISDAWTFNIITRELSENYYLLRNGKLPTRDRKPSYLDYVLYEEEYKYMDKFEKDRRYWSERFENEPEFTLFKLRDSNYLESTKANRKTFIIDTELVIKIKQYCAHYKTSVHTLFFTVLAIYLNRITLHQDIVIGTPVLNRSSAKEKDTIGIFISHVPVRFMVNEESGFLDYIQEVTKEWLLVLKHQRYPYELLLREYREKHNKSDALFYDILFSFQNARLEIDEYFPDYKGRWHFCRHQPETLCVHISDREDEGMYVVNFDYLENLISESEILMIYQQYMNILLDAIDHPSKKVKELDLLSSQEKQRIVDAFNNTNIAYPWNETIHSLFEEQVVKMPSTTALIYKSASEVICLSYLEVNERANQIARVLKEKGINRDQIVGIIIDRSPEMIFGLLAILKAGGAYLPLDPDYPMERIEYMLNDSGAKILLTKSNILNTISFPGDIVAIDDSFITRETSNLGVNNSSQDLAYVIYTSGSTGKPKGVMIEHRAVLNFIQGITNQIPFKPNKTILALTSISFDIFFVETLLPLICGMRTVILDNEQNYYGSFDRIIKDFKVELLQITPSRLKLLVENTESHWLECLEQLMVGGEPFPQTLLTQLQEKTRARIFNMYGPTETTIWSTIRELTNERKVDIGQPIANTQIYIIDKYQRLQPIGTPGELCIGGEGLARGYLGQENLTGEKFINNPFAPGQKMYRTGDLAKWKPDGNIEFLGRIDNQVKIRGFRIELEEIEFCLLQHKSVKEAVVVGREDDKGNAYLCAYLVVKNEIPLFEIRSHLRSWLPDYMIPSHFIYLESLPLTPNGKINKKALPKPSENTLRNLMVAPETKTEISIAKIWEEVLQIEQVGVTENFFELGGDSIDSISLALKISKQFDVIISVKDIFRHATIRELASYVQAQKKVCYQQLKPIPKSEAYPVSSAEKRIYILSQLEGAATLYNMPLVMEIKGTIEKDSFEKAFQILIERQEAFRCSYQYTNGQLVRIIASNIDFHIDELNISEDALQNAISDFFKPFDLNKSPLLRVQLLKTDLKQLLLINLHHIIADGFSINLLIKELDHIFQEKELSYLSIQYKDFAAWQNELLHSGAIIEQKKYWEQVFEGEIPVLNIPLDFSRPVIQSFIGDRLTFQIDKDLTDQVSKLSAMTGTTHFMVLLAVYNILLSKYTSQDDIIIGSPVTGRNHTDLQNIIGMFVNTIALRNYPKDKLGFIEFLADVKENVLKALENQDYQFEELVEQLKISRDMGRNPLFDTMFILQNYDISDINLGNIELTPYKLFKNNVAKFDLTIQVWENNNGLIFEFEYCTALFKQETIERMANHFVNVLRRITQCPEIELAEIELLSEVEKRQILFDFNSTNKTYPKDKTIHQLFEEMAEIASDNIAMVYENEYLTYSQLNRKSNQLARFLRERGVKSNDIVGIMVDRSFEMVIGIFGILKAGGAYLPIDPEYPSERIEYMLMDSNAKILLSEYEFVKGIQFDKDIFYLDNPVIFTGNDSNLFTLNKPSDLIYIIYTSGSTGKPKGVMMRHYSIINVLWAFYRMYPFTDSDVYLLKTNISFDVSVTELFGWFFGKGKLSILNPGGEKETLSIVNAIKKYKVTHINFVPSMLNVFINTLNNEDLEIVGSLKYVFVAGEAITSNIIEKFYRMFNKVKFENQYGPTESFYTNTFSLSNYRDTVNVPIGKPLPNIKNYILDKTGHLCSIGVPGELFLAGEGLAKGYLNRPELNLEKFIANPFAPGELMYKTGDLVRWLPDGNIEYLGRIDNQVKIRGFRIELGEIESKLIEHDEIDNAIVICQFDNNKKLYLCAYYVLKDQNRFIDLKGYLAERLPSYMIPSHFIKLVKMPFLSNGKIDRKKLPDPGVFIDISGDYVPPRDEIEKLLIDIWCQVLGQKNIGVYDNFFEIGGDSLSLMQIQTMIFSKGWRFSFQDFYKHQTVAEFAKKMKGIINETDNQLIYESEISVYPEKIETLPVEFSPETRDERNILLSGTTGFLGIHILNELLENTGANVYCLIREKDNVAAEKRLDKILDFYLLSKHKSQIGKRLFIVDGDLALDKFGLSNEEYHTLETKIDTIFHTAALVKFYGDYQTFKNVNIDGTKRIIDFALSFNKRLNYISTTGILKNVESNKDNKACFNEYDFFVGQKYKKDLYVYSKFCAENEVLFAIKSGLDAKIFRVGNLTERHLDGKFQINVKENMFHNILKSIMEIGLIPDYLMEQDLEFTPVDLCSQAIIKLASPKETNHKIFHVFNHNYIKLRNYLKIISDLGIDVQTINCSLKDYFEIALSQNKKPEALNFLISNLEQEYSANSQDRTFISSEITDGYLMKLGFIWPWIDAPYISKTIFNFEKDNHFKTHELVK